MMDYQPIGDLIKSIPEAAWDALEAIHEKRCAIMLGELLDIAKNYRAPKAEPERREPRSLKNHPSTPRAP